MFTSFCSKKINIFEISSKREKNPKIQSDAKWVIQKCINDPSLDLNPRVLANLLKNEENYLSVNYFKNGTQKDVKPWMRRMVTTWMLEVIFFDKNL